MGYLHFALKKSTTNHTPAASHYNYIMREGKHSNKGDVHEFIVGEAFNIPPWATMPKEFFEAADKYERKNGIVYREIEIGLPNELPLEENIDIVHQVIDRCIGQDKPLAYAIHKKYSKVNAALGIQSLNIHAHIMFSERSITNAKEEIKPAELFFKRYNKSNPEKGGYKKDNRFSGSKKEIAQFVIRCREFLADKINDKFRQYEIDDSVTHLSIKDQKINAKATNDIEKIKMLEKKEKTRITYREYKKLEAILLSKTSLDEKISRITDLDVREIIEGKQKRTSSGKYTSRFRQKMLCLKELSEKIKKLEIIKQEPALEDNHTRYLTEIIAKLGQRLYEAKNYKVKRISKIEQSKYYNNKYLNTLAINIVTKGLYLKYLKLLNEIKKLQENGKDSSALLKKAAGYNEKINAMITPLNKKRTKEIYERYKIKKQEFSKIAGILKRDVIKISEVLNKIATISSELKREKDIKAINVLLPQNVLREIEQSAEANIKKGKKGLDGKDIEILIGKAERFIDEAQATLINKKKAIKGIEKGEKESNIFDR